MRLRRPEGPAARCPLIAMLPVCCYLVLWQRTQLYVIAQVVLLLLGCWCSCASNCHAGIPCCAFSLFTPISPSCLRCLFLAASAEACFACTLGCETLTLWTPTAGEPVELVSSSGPMGSGGTEPAAAAADAAPAQPAVQQQQGQGPPGNAAADDDEPPPPEPFGESTADRRAEHHFLPMLLLALACAYIYFQHVRACWPVLCTCVSCWQQQIIEYRSPLCRVQPIEQLVKVSRRGRRYDAGRGAVGASVMRVPTGRPLHGRWQEQD